MEYNDMEIVYDSVAKSRKLLLTEAELKADLADTFRIMQRCYINHLLGKEMMGDRLTTEVFDRAEKIYWTIAAELKRRKK